MENRVIKFRAFNADTNEMVYPTKEGWFNKLYLGSNGSWQDIQLSTLINHTPKDIFYSQSTGLFDKNGKDIYEGDIVRCWYSRDTTMTDIIIFNEEVVFEVSHEFSGFKIDFLSTAEIIGNVYEHPELLK